MYYKCKKLHEAVNLKKPGDNKKAKALWPFKRVQKKVEGYNDPRSTR